MRQESKIAEVESSRAGMGLIFTLFFISVTGLVTGVLLSSAITNQRLAQRHVNRERALNVAEAGLERMCQWIAIKQGILTTPLSMSGTLNGNTWAVSASKVDEFVYRIDSTGDVQGVKWTVHGIRVELPSWAQYALWMDENGVIYFIGGETFYGWVHSNDRLYFSQTGGQGANFYDKLTSAATDYGGTTNGAYFAKGFQMNANQGDIADVDFDRLETAAQTFGLVLDGATAITLQGTRMLVTNSRKGWNKYSVSIGTNSIVYIRNATSGTTSTRPGKLSLGGKLDGRLTIATEDDINITNHVTYAADPRTNSSSDDALGLVSMDDINVETSAPNNLQIFAAMLATGEQSNNDGSFGVTEYDRGSPRGDLTVWGSIVQEVRGPVGTFNNQGITSGFRKNYGYDSRFRTAAPPFYPRVDTKINVEGWREGPPG